MNQVAERNIAPFSKRLRTDFDNLRPLRQMPLCMIGWGQDARLRQQKAYFGRNL
jgi:hypothetical protein